MTNHKCPECQYRTQQARFKSLPTYAAKRVKDLIKAYPVALENYTESKMLHLRYLDLLGKELTAWVHGQTLEEIAANSAVSKTCKKRYEEVEMAMDDLVRALAKLSAL